MKKLFAKSVARLVLELFSGLLLATSAAFAAAPAIVTQFPKTLSADCEDNTAKIYEGCLSQVDILQDAVAAAKKDRKSVLVVYGAEWCSWCHTLDHAIHGEFLSNDNEWRLPDDDIQSWTKRKVLTQQSIKDGANLQRYIADNFVVAHLNNDHITITEAVAITGYDSTMIEHLPYLLVLDKIGHFVTTADPSTHAYFYYERDTVDDQFANYDRASLLRDLRRVRVASKDRRGRR